MVSVSVVVPTHNRLARLKQVLDALAQQTFPQEQFEVIVVSDGSTDGTDEYLRAPATPLMLRALYQQNQGPAAARNLGVAHAGGDVILFIDDDVVPSPQLIAEHVRVHDAESGAVAVMGPMLAPVGCRMEPWIRWEHDRLVRQYRDMEAGKWLPTARQFYTGNTSLPRSYIVAAGGFDHRFRRAEDIELGYRLAKRGLRFVFNASAIGWHHIERSFESWEKTPYTYGRNEVVFARELENTELISTLISELQRRHPLVQALNRLCLDHHLRSRLVLNFLRLIVDVGRRVGANEISMSACSGIFNLRYYQGIADELGGRRTLYARLAGLAVNP